MNILWLPYSFNLLSLHVILTPSALAYYLIWICTRDIISLPVLSLIWLQLSVLWFFLFQESIKNSQLLDKQSF
jgi:hypothetical protein